ncbi:MAG TPA: thioesterase family protein [Chloroflexia bacterium]|nr:thioesterase family protein [Chloroflexia bacterium]
MREYRWQLKVRSYEGDAWGYLSSAWLLRYLEHSAVMAAADVGYGSQFHQENRSAWVIRRMTLLMPNLIRLAQDLEIVTWISHFARVRGGREYRVFDAAGELVATGIAEWVYMDRATLTPLAIPQQTAIDFDVPGAPLGNYDPPPLGPPDETEGWDHSMSRVAYWHECDSLGHVNNAVYTGWLDDAMFAALEAHGTSITAQREAGLRLCGVYYKLDYKRAALPGDELIITTHLERQSGPSYAVSQRILSPDGTALLTASSIYSWQSVR